MFYLRSVNFANAKFLRSYSLVEQITDNKNPEFAFIGRSNVGKSSLINALTNKKDMAKTSAKPGKTQLVNFFDVESILNLVDLPGYGYAKVSKQKMEVFEELITEYLLRSDNLFIVFALIDAAIPPQRIDLEFMAWCGEPVVIFTKTDKKKSKIVEANMTAFEDELSRLFEHLPVTFETSANTKRGIETLSEWIEEQLQSIAHP